MLDAVSVLRGMEGEDKPLLGRRVVVYGGGNTALDVARTAKRLGATESIIVYRRTREKMPAHDFEVEEALLEHPGVSEACVVGAPDAEWGEVVVAFIVGSAEPDDLNAHLLQRIARFKRPKRYLTVDQLPKNSYGKVLKRQLRSRSDAARRRDLERISRSRRTQAYPPDDSKRCAESAHGVCRS